jgi:hypothetical protein
MLHPVPFQRCCQASSGVIPVSEDHRAPPKRVGSISIVADEGSMNLV